jgi:hypothetical protein
VRLNQPGMELSVKAGRAVDRVGVLPAVVESIVASW